MSGRGQTRARAREEVEHVPHYALLGQKTPPPEERPAPLSEVAGPQRRSLRGADGVDGTTVSFLLAANLKLQKEEESARESLERAQRFLDRATSKRKRKKRKRLSTSL